MEKGPAQNRHISSSQGTVGLGGATTHPAVHPMQCVGAGRGKSGSWVVILLYIAFQGGEGEGHGDEGWGSGLALAGTSEMPTRQRHNKAVHSEQPRLHKLLLQVLPCRDAGEGEVGAGAAGAAAHALHRLEQVAALHASVPP